MKVYISYLVKNFLSSIIFVSLILISLIFILNILGEIEFFKNIPVKQYYPIFLAAINSPSLIFEMFPFIFLISTQIFFLNLFNNNQIQIFKYSGLKNTQIIKIITITAFFLGFLIIIFFYNFSSNLKNYYLELKFKHTADGKYLAVITNNGLWIKDVVEGNISIVNAQKIEENFLINTFITQFDNDFNVIRNIKSKKVDINRFEWILYDAEIYKDGIYNNYPEITLNSNFDYRKIKNLFSNLSSLSLVELFQLKTNYKNLNYSTTEVNVEIHKIISYPIYLTSMTIFGAILMLNFRQIPGNTLKIVIGLFLSVIIYYINNFFYVMGNTEKLSIINSIWGPQLFLIFLNILIMKKINEK